MLIYKYFSLLHTGKMHIGKNTVYLEKTITCYMHYMFDNKSNAFQRMETKKFILKNYPGYWNYSVTYLGQL